jgi:hypothetical protein
VQSGKQLEHWSSGTCDMKPMKFFVCHGSHGRLTVFGGVGKNHGVQPLPRIEIFLVMAMILKMKIRLFFFISKT